MPTIGKVNKPKFIIDPDKLSRFILVLCGTVALLKYILGW